MLSDVLRLVPVTEVLAVATEAAASGPGHQPIPVGDCRPAHRMLSQIAGDPPVTARHHGAVASLRSDPVAPLAALLATRTGRPHRTYPDVRTVLGDAGGDPLTLVLGPHRLTDAQLAECSLRDGVGVLTARDVGTLSVLVAKSILGTGSRAVTRGGTVAVDTMNGTPGEANPTTLGPLRERLGQGVEVLMLSTHGRECLVHLDDGVICGRAAVKSSSVAPAGTASLGRTSCEWGEGCFREHWRGDRLLPAADLSASIVFLDSCGALKAGTAQFGIDTTLVLSLLESDALAVVGSPWTRDGLPQVPDVFTAALRAGESLAGAVATVNAAVTASARSVGRFGLLGDAGLCLEPLGTARPTLTLISPGPTVVPASGVIMRAPEDVIDRTTLAGHVTGVRLSPREIYVVPSPATPARDEPAEVGLAPRPPRATLTVLADACAALTDCWALGTKIRQGPLVGARRQLLEAHAQMADRLPGPEDLGRLDAATAIIAELDREIAEQLLAATTKGRMHLIERYSPHSVREQTRPATCPECGGVAERNDWRHVIATSLRRQVISCHSCTEVSDSDPNSRVGARLRGEQQVARGGVLAQSVELVNRSDIPVSGWLAFALLHEEYYGARLRTLEPFSLDGEGQTTICLDHPVPASFTTVDRHYLRAYIVAGGRVSVRNRPIWVTPEVVT